MYKTLGNNITLTRGDTLQLKVSLYNQDGTEYEPASGDVIRFAMKKEYTDALPVLSKTIPNETCLLVIDPLDTKSLAFGQYV